VSRIAEAFSLRRNVYRLLHRSPAHEGALDGLRALSVLWVVLFHVAWFSRFAVPVPQFVRLVFAPWMLPIWRGDFGVDVFFVLSGFLIGGMLLDERAKTGRVALGRFYLRRLLRLWPALLILAGLEIMSNHPNRRMVWWGVFYLNDMVPVAVVSIGWTWSLAIEEQFYLFCPGLLRVIARFETRGRVIVISALLLLLIAFAAWVVSVFGFRPWDAEIIGNPNMVWWGVSFDVLYDKPWMRGGALLAGVLAAQLYRAGSVMKRIAEGGVRVSVSVLAAVAVMVASTHWPLVVGAPRAIEVLYLASFRTVFGLSVAYVILVVLSKHPLGQRVGRALSARWLYPFSQLAYSAYLLNPMVTMAEDDLLRPMLETVREPLLVLLPLNFVGTFAAATVVHLAVERPGMELRPRSQLDRPSA
jgi:peptidoglycan/LPS O-acetylase OafA/YrhL